MMRLGMATDAMSSNEAEWQNARAIMFRLAPSLYASCVRWPIAAKTYKGESVGAVDKP